MACILERLNYWVDRNPEKLLYAFLDLGGKQTESYTYENLLQRINTIAIHLRRFQRFGTNDRVLLAYPPGLEMICAFFGCARAGVIPVPVYPPSANGFQVSLYRMAHIAKDCGAAGMLTTRELDSALEKYMAGIGRLEIPPEAEYISSCRRIITEGMQGRLPEQRFEGGEILFLQYTSGSTSSPRGVMVTHENILHNCHLVVDHSSPVAVSWLPQYHDMGLIGYYLYSALSGGTTFGLSPIDFIQRPALWFETIKKYRATATSAPNFAFEFCLHPGRLSKVTTENADLSSLRFLMTAAEPVRPSTYQRFLEKFQPLGLRPESFYVAYGLAENTLAVSSYGRNILSVSKKAMALGKVRITSEVSEIAGAKLILSCGKSLGDVVLIVDPEKKIALEDGNIGEIWVSGKSKCLGYWNNAELTEKTFHARVAGGTPRPESFLRSGDLGFLYQGELYVCGRTKDMIIVRGQNYYPQDIEQIVEETTDLVRKSSVVAFEIEENQASALAIVAEVKSARVLPDPRDIVTAIRSSLNLAPALIAFVVAKSVPKTSSGKIMRGLTRQMWLEGKIKTLQQFGGCELMGPGESGANASPFEVLRTRYQLKGNETYNLIQAGVDSLDLVVLLHEIKELLKEKGSPVLAGEVDVRVIQEISVADLFRLADLFERFPETAILEVRHLLFHLIEEHHKREEQMMLKDRILTFVPTAINKSRSPDSEGAILLTGGTGFVGPFLLKSLLEQTKEDIYVLVRGSDDSAARDRVRESLESIAIATTVRPQFYKRVTVVAGDLEQPRLGLPENRWKFLASHIRTIYHNGAGVNYLLNYQKMRAANVAGTNEVVTLAFESCPKVLNYVSTTFIFGWAVKDTLFETDSNDKMELLDFGYSQSKWVAEQIVFDAGRHGMSIRVFRPALLSPSIMGEGNNLDIAIRLLAFMINHGIGVTALNQVSFVPADVAANNIVAISNLSGTANSTYHVTRDEYANMIDITDIITRLTGQRFELFKLPDFVPRVIRRCSKHDPLFPLLDFLIGSVDNIASMEVKRYDSSCYRRARDASRYGQPDPSLQDTVAGILRFMSRKKLISVDVPSRASVQDYPKETRAAKLDVEQRAAR